MLKSVWGGIMLRLYCLDVSRACQFCETDNSFLDWFDNSSESAHPVFGRIIENYDLVVGISNVPTRNDNPVEPIRVISVRVE